MLTIYKYPFIATTLDMPKGAKILTVQAQGVEVFIWAMVDTDMPTEGRRFIAYGTGAEIMPSDLKFLTYVNTLQFGRLVWHIFEVKE